MFFDTHCISADGHSRSRQEARNRYLHNTMHTVIGTTGQLLAAFYV